MNSMTKQKNRTVRHFPYILCESLRNTREISEKHIFYGLLILMIILLIPMLMIARHDVPSVDDYMFGAATHRVWLQSHSLLQVLKAAANQVAFSYSTWQGSFAAIMLFSLHPAIFGEQWYFLTPFVLLFCLGCGIFCLCRQTMRAIGCASKYQTGIVTVVALTLCTQFLPSPVQGFYWFNGSVYYTFFFGLSLMLFAGLLAEHTAPFRHLIGFTVTLSLLSFIIGGGNLVTGLTTAIGFALLLLGRALQKDKKSLLCSFIPFVFFTAGFLLNILAPGNAVRMAAESSTHTSMLNTVLLSLRGAAAFICSSLHFPMICLLVFLIPCLYRTASSSTLTFRRPYVVLLLSYGLIAAGLCPSIYVYGAMPSPSRLTNILFYAVVLLLMFDLFYCLGWLHRKVLNRFRFKTTYTVPFVVAVSVTLVAGAVLLQRPTCTSAHAALSLASGDAAAYSDTAKQRLEILLDDRVTDAVLPAYPTKPIVLYFDDITADPTNYRNIGIQAYYGKNSVILEGD